MASIPSQSQPPVSEELALVDGFGLDNVCKRAADRVVEHLEHGQAFAASTPCVPTASCESVACRRPHRRSSRWLEAGRPSQCRRSLTAGTGRRRGKQRIVHRERAVEVAPGPVEAFEVVHVGEPNHRPGLDRAVDRPGVVDAMEEAVSGGSWSVTRSVCAP